MKIALAVLAVAVSTVGAAAAMDRRELVVLPPPMQEHMLGNMRDHLMALGDILAALAAGEVAAAARTAETRIGMSSLERHGATHLAPLMPEPMRRIGGEMHGAASRFVIAAQDAEIADGEAGRRALFAALADITAACNACHAAYRIR